MRLVSFLLMALFGLSLHAEPLKLDTDRARISYSLGHQIGLNLKQQAGDLDPEIVKRGLEDGLSGASPRMSEDDMSQAWAELRRQIIEAQLAEEKKMAATRLTAGRAFLAGNKKKAGVVTLPDGLQYRVVKAGTGRKPSPDDTVTVNYRGTLIDGTEFDSSYRRNEPATFRLDSVIKGWTEGLQQMKEGGKYELFVPPELAYGDRGQLANQTLVFEIELISVKSAADKEAAK